MALILAECCCQSGTQLVGMLCTGGLSDDRFVGGRVYDTTGESYDYGLTLAPPLL